MVIGMSHCPRLCNEAKPTAEDSVSTQGSANKILRRGTLLLGNFLQAYVISVTLERYS